MKNLLIPAIIVLAFLIGLGFVVKTLENKAVQTCEQKAEKGEIAKPFNCDMLKI